ncbi:hypothetical protein ACEZCY_14035 [Streptacidiphilus sp. N1-12]|uniref:Uncharacterized protein n=2 Tax=Streptacidiphilus alkalitolerans TaxID=3342712 RepID=A0ABV6WED1_9ACTN
MPNWVLLLVLCVAALAPVLAYDHYQRRRLVRIQAQLATADQLDTAIRDLPDRDLDHLLSGIRRANEDPDTNAW